MEQRSSFKNLLSNTTKRQKIGIITVVLVIVTLLIIIFVMIGNIPKSQEGPTQENPETSTYVNDSGYTVKVETYFDENGNEVRTETYVDENGNSIVTTTYVNDDGETVTENSYTDEAGETIRSEVITMQDGETIVEGTKEDEYGNVTTLNPELITTYFPYQVMREHEDWPATLRYRVSVDEENKVINALVENCDEENDRKLVREYLKSIPIDLKSYEVKFETFSEDSICEY